VPDNGPNRTVILNEETEDAFYKSYYENFALVPVDKRDYNVMSNTLSKFGISYDVPSFEKFFDENAKSTPAKAVGGKPTEGMTDIKLNDKPAKLYAEVQGNLVMKNGIVTVGKGKNSSGDMTGGFPSDLPDEPYKVSHIHTHPIWKKTKFSYKRGGLPGGGDFPRPGPSGMDGDRGYAGRNVDRHGVRTVVVDANNVYIINGWADQDVIIKRK
jgi:hypothetical protein